MSKILIIGADGQLAFDLIRTLKKKHEVFEVRHNDFDVRNKSKVGKFIKKISPDVVINTAAFHNTEKCEKNSRRSFAVNALGAYNVARAAKGVGAAVFFISSDYVFDGEKKYFTEDDTPNPLNIYGASKLAGEVLTKIANEKSYVIRTNAIFGEKISGKGHNFVTLMIQKAKNKEELKVVDDEFGCLTYSHDLAEKIAEFVKKKPAFGVYHITNTGFSSWYGFAKELLGIAGIKAKITPISGKDRKTNLIRPKYGCIKSVNLKKAGISPLRPWQEAVREYIKICMT